MPHRADRDPGEEVEVLLAVGVPDARALPAHQLDWRPRICLHGPAGLQLLQLRALHAVFCVPMPASVKSSSSSVCGRLPSTMCVASTPPAIASTHAVSFG